MLGRIRKKKNASPSILKIILPYQFSGQKGCMFSGRKKLPQSMDACMDLCERLFNTELGQHVGYARRQRRIFRCSTSRFQEGRDGGAFVFVKQERAKRSRRGRGDDEKCLCWFTVGLIQRFFPVIYSLQNKDTVFTDIL